IRQYRTKPLKTGEGVETGWRAPHVGEGTVRLSSKDESDRITQRSAVQIRPPQPRTPRQLNAVAFTRLTSTLSDELARRHLPTSARPLRLIKESRAVLGTFYQTS